MYSRSLFLKLDKFNICSVNDGIMIREYLESFICYISKKILVDANYPDMDIRYNYSKSRIHNAFNAVEQLYIVPHLKENLLNINHILTRSIEETIHEFYMSDYAATGSLNINSMLINCDTLLITYEFFNK